MSDKKRRLPQIVAAAAVMAMVAAAPAFAASGWVMEDGQWTWQDRKGDRVTDTWKKNDKGDHWFYLKDDGYMAVSQLVERDDDLFYVNEDGAMVRNEWRLLEDDSDDEAYTNGTCWYYFDSSGKAVKNTSGKVKLTTINGKRYIFDENGRMLYGWVTEDGTMVDDDSDWASGLYYCRDEDNGAVVVNDWRLIQVDDPEGDDDAEENYWFYFGANGKKIVDATKTINKRKYQFDERGVAQFKWNFSTASNASSGTATSPVASASNYKYYNMPDQCWLATGWVYTVPDENVDPEAHADDEPYWFYMDKNGKQAVSQIKTVSGYKYAFNEKGEMLEGLYAITFDQDKKIQTYEEIEDISDMPGEDEACSVYYFGNTPKDGVMATKKNVEIELDDRYTFGFRANGEGIHGILDNAIYIKGRKLKADKDQKLQVVTFAGEEYLINTSGTIQKKKTNVKDAEDTYYCTDAKGIVTYVGQEKQQK